jgi:hypothetical protein
MSAALELHAQVAVVVNLSVVDDRARAILVEDGLVAAGNVDDGQAPHPQADLIVYEESVVVRPAVANGVARGA